MVYKWGFVLKKAVYCLANITHYIPLNTVQSLCNLQVDDIQRHV